MQTLPEPGLELAPFRGIRYAPDRVSDIANVTSPPYDVIGTGGLGHLLSADPHNIVRLILPGRAPDASAQAASRLREWLADGTLIRDDSPGLYVYEQSTDSWRQRGLIALVKLGRGVLPHEDVMPGPVAGRRELMAATSANLEPIFLVYDGPVDVCDAADGAPLVSAVTEDGVTHRLWSITDPAVVAGITGHLAGRRALIADGHHRYAAYLELRDRMRHAGLGDGPWDYGLAFLVDSAAYPPRLGAIHRMLPGLAPERAAELAGRAFKVAELAGDLPAAVSVLSDLGRNAAGFLIAGDPGSFWLLSDPDPAELDAAMPASALAAWRDLDAAVLQELLLGRLWGISDSEEDVLVFHDASDAVEAAAVVGGTAVLTNPVPIESVQAIAAAGGRVPRKSTSFGPKPRSGLVFRTFDA